MENMEKKQKGFVGYEYKEVIAEGSMASLLLDGYESFGWELDENLSAEGRNEKTLRLKRNRKIINKMELTRLQRNFEACIGEIQTLEKNKTSKATIYAIICGIIGTAFMAGSTFAVTAQPPYIILCIILAVPGLIGWILPYFLYKRTVWKQTEKMSLLIEEKYDEIYEICEKGSKLLY